MLRPPQVRQDLIARHTLLVGFARVSQDLLLFLGKSNARRARLCHVTSDAKHPRTEWAPK